MPKKFDTSKRRKLMDIKLVSGITMPQNKKGGHQNALELKSRALKCSRIKKWGIKMLLNTKLDHQNALE
jgi:hypothetical protein